MSSPAGTAQVTASLEDARLRRFAVLFELEKKARRCERLEELGFVIVNETHNLVRYRQALFWEREGKGGRVAALSGLAVPDRSAPFVVWAERLLAWLATHRAQGGSFGLSDLPPQWQEDWASWFPPQALLVPLSAARAGVVGFVLLVRDEAWTAAEEVVVGNLADAYGHAWFALRRRSPWYRRLLRQRWRNALVLALVAALALFPVHHSVVAPVEVVAKDPAVVRTSVEGVIDTVLVEPNQTVEPGQPLVALDKTRIENRLEVARKARDIAEAELRQTSQQAVFDPESKPALAILRGRLEQSQSEVGYYEQLLERALIRAPRAGIAIFDDADELVGKPVALGEKVMMVAAPEQVEAQVLLPAADAIALRDALLGCQASGSWTRQDATEWWKERGGVIAEQRDKRKADLSDKVPESALTVALRKRGDQVGVA